jgi:hypothetical protein
MIMLYRRFHGNDGKTQEEPKAHGQNPAKDPKFQYKALWYSIDRKFSSCPATKKCAPYFCGNTQFPIYLKSTLVTYQKTTL